MEGKEPIEDASGTSDRLEAFCDGEGICRGIGLEAILWSIQELLLLLDRPDDELKSRGWLFGKRRLKTNSLCLKK